jgi:hypothetical protein
MTSSFVCEARASPTRGRSAMPRGTTRRATDRPTRKRRGEGQDATAVPSRGKLSYPYVLRHDAHVGPDECGGPLVDLHGWMIGLNIARQSIYQTCAIPALKPLLRDLDSGKLAPRVKADQRRERGIFKMNH